MRYIDNFNRYIKLNESPTYKKNIPTTEDIDLIEGLEYCFLPVFDILGKNDENKGIRIKMPRKRIAGGKHLPFSIYGLYEVMIMPEIIDEDYSKLYRATNFNNELVNEIVNSISVSETIDLVLVGAMVKWIYIIGGANEQFTKTVNKIFLHGKQEPPSGKLVKGSYGLEYLYDFLTEQDDKIRWVKLFFKKKE